MSVRASATCHGKARRAKSEALIYRRAKTGGSVAKLGVLGRIDKISALYYIVTQCIP